jgi:hypothetical protein
LTRPGSRSREREYPPARPARRRPAGWLRHSLGSHPQDVPSRCMPPGKPPQPMCRKTPLPQLFAAKIAYPTGRPESPSVKICISIGVRRRCSVYRRTTMLSMTVVSGKHPTRRLVFSPQYACYGVAILAGTSQLGGHHLYRLVCNACGGQLYGWEAVERVWRSAPLRSATPPRAPVEQEASHA